MVILMTIHYYCEETPWKPLEGTEDSVKLWSLQKYWEIIRCWGCEATIPKMYNTVEINIPHISSLNEKAFCNLEKLQIFSVSNCQKLTSSVFFLVQATQKHYYNYF